ncbi:MAG: hypothetical protein ACF8NJ_07595 [Phycisphaerales bacterium JB038]
MTTTRKTSLPALLVTLTLAGAASATPTFSIDFQGPTKGMPDGFWGAPITEGDILTPSAGVGFGPLPTPGIAISGGFGPPAPGLALPLHAGAMGIPGGVAGRVEVDALSYGVDYVITPDAQTFYHFSVDEFATGFGGTPLPPNVFTEGAAGGLDASADVFRDLGLPAGPLPPFVGPIGNTGVLDGDGFGGFSGFVYPGTGLIEPNTPTFGLPDQGDNLDALDMDTSRALWDDPAGLGGPVYFSLDADFADPYEPGANTGSALLNGGFSGGDVLVTYPGAGGPVVYAPAVMLGLDFHGYDTDDLDALVLWENGDGMFTPSMQPYDWLAGVSDMLLFSVRRGSAVIGTIDSLLGLPIEEGDILMPPVAGTATPGIFIAAENLGLATVRSGLNQQQFGDDLDALDVLVPQPGTLALFGLSALTLRRRR